MTLKSDFKFYHVLFFVSVDADKFREYKGHREVILKLLFDISVYNHSPGLDADEFINKLVTDAGLKLEKLDGSTYGFGHVKYHDGYVQYGTITKINLL